jgi:RNA polymerase sigma-70 factor (ECF subfamily)
LDQHEHDDDLTLVSRSQAGDRAAFEQLIRRTSKLLWAHLLPKCSGDRHRTEDLVQETLLSAWKKLDTLHDRRSFRPWLITIANYTLIDSARHESRKKRRSFRLSHREDMVAEATTSADAPDESVAKVEERRRVLSVLESLPEEYRVPLSLRYLAGADYETIGKQLALSNGSLRGLLQRGMKMLRERMTESS